MTILIHIGQRQNSSSSYFTSCGKIGSAFKLSECKQESECKFPMSSGAGVTFLGTGTGAGVKKVTPITSERFILQNRIQKLWATKSARLFNSQGMMTSSKCKQTCIKILSLCKHQQKPRDLKLNFFAAYSTSLHESLEGLNSSLAHSDSEL